MLGGVEVGLERVERQHPDEAVADQQWNCHPRPDASLDVDILELRVARGGVREDDGPVPLDQVPGRIAGSAHAVAMSDQFVEVRIAVAAVDHPLVAVEPLDAGTPVGDDLAKLRQDQVEDFGHAQRAPQRLGCGAESLGLFAGSSLGLEQARVFDRHRGLGGECRRDFRQLFGVEIGLELVDAEHADDAVADDHRGTDPSANASTAVQLTRKVRVLRHVGEDLSPLRPHDLDC